MKNTILAVILAFAATFATAGSVTVDYDHFTGFKAPNTNAISVTPSIDALGLTFDAKLQAARGVEGKTSNAVELRVAKSFVVAPNTSVFVRGGIGKIYVDNTSGSFYSIEPGFKYSVDDKLSLNTSYKFTSSLNNSKNLKTSTVFIGADYKLTKVDAVGIKLYKESEDTSGRGFVVGYTRSF